MSDFVFEHPERWPLLLLPLLLLLLRLGAGVRRRRVLQRFAAFESQPALLVDAAPRGRALGSALEFAGLLLAVAAALEPAWGVVQLEAERRGVELVVCLDTSRSMLVPDLAPDRLSRAKKDIKTLLPELRGDRVGLVAFAGDAKVVCPLTHDLAAFEGLLERADTETTRLGGTDLGAALRASLALLPREGAPSQAIVILTDGEDLAGQGLGEAERARARGVRVHAIGYGSTGGAKVPGREAGTFLKNELGSDVISRLDAQGLRQLCGAAGGTYLGAQDVSLPLVELFEKRVRPMEQKNFEKQQLRSRRARYQWALLPGFFLLLLAWVVPRRRVRSES